MTLNIANPSEVPFMCSTLGRLLTLPINIRLDWKACQGNTI
jgi:hypothetical protein